MKRRAIIVLVLVFLLVLGLLWFIGHSVDYRSAAEAYKRDLRARGEKLTIPELPSAGTTFPGWLQQFLAAVSNYNGLADPPPMMTLTGPGVAAVGHTNLTPAQSLGYGENVQTVAKLRDALGTNHLPFNLKLTAGYQFNLTRSERLAAATAMQALATNDLPEAQAALFLAVDLVRLDDPEPTLLSHLIRASDARVALEATWEALQDDRWTEAQLANLQARWQGMDLFSGSGPAWRTEFAEEIQSLADARRSYQQMVDHRSPTSGAAASSAGTGVAGRILSALKELYDRYPGFRRWRNVTSFAEEIYVLQVTDADLAACQQAEAEGAFVPAWQKYNERLAALNRLYPDRTNQFKLYGSVDSSWRTFLVAPGFTETARRMAVAAIALKRYQLAHHQYPATLSELIPEFLPQVPADFMDGKPLRYKLRGDGSFLLYSVGWDGEDSGGDATFSNAVAVGSWEWAQSRDIVWPRAATQKEVEDYRKAQKHKTGTGGDGN